MKLDIPAVELEKEGLTIEDLEYLEHLPYHLDKAGMIDELKELLKEWKG